MAKSFWDDYLKNKDQVKKDTASIKKAHAKAKTSAKKEIELKSNVIARNKANANKMYSSPKYRTQTIKKPLGGTRTITSNKNQHKSVRNASSAGFNKAMKEALNTTGGRFYSGVVQGLYNTTPLAVVKPAQLADKRVKNSTSAKAGNMLGTTFGYLTGYGAISNTAAKGATKVVTSKLGKKAVSSLAKKTVAKKAATAALKKEGKMVTESLVKKGAKDFAEKTIKGATKAAIADATVGTAINNNLAIADGKKFGSKEYWNEMARNAAFDFGLGGATEALPLIKTMLKSGKSKTAIKKVLEKEGKLAVKTNTKASVKTAKANKLFNQLQEGAKAQAEQNARLNALKKASDLAETKVPTTYKQDVKNLKDVAIKTTKNAKTPKLAEKKLVDTITDNRALASKVMNDNGFVSTMKSKYDKPLQTVAKENNVDLDALIKDEYQQYKAGLNAEGKPLNSVGADTYKISTEAENVKRYGATNNVPNATPYGEVSQGARTLYNSPINDDMARKTIMQGVNEGNYTKVYVSNKTALDNAQSMIDNGISNIKKQSIQSADNALTHGKNNVSANEYFDSIATSGKQVTSEDIALGYKLAQDAMKKGDYEKMGKVLEDVCAMESEAGRTLQAMRLFNSLSPEGRIKTVISETNKLAERNGVKGYDVPNELLDKLANAQGERELQQVKDEIATHIWNQIPPTWLEKVNAWRYMSMLGNPKTHIRNVIGNAIFTPIKGVRNIIGTGLEKGYSKIGKIERSKSILTHNDKNLIAAGKEDFSQVSNTLMGGSSKYIDARRPQSSPVFKSKALNKYNSLINWSLEGGDKIFMEQSYKRSYAQYLKANGIKDLKQATPDLLERARKYASEECLNSTYRDASVLADKLSNFKKYGSMKFKDIPSSYDVDGRIFADKLAKKTGGLMVDAIMPFTKTPINVMRRGIDYSPLGIIKGLNKIIRAGGNTNTVMKGISDLAEGLTGSGVMMLGYFAGKSGIAQGSLDWTDDFDKFRQQNGEQEYAITIGDHTYTFDWAAPMCLPFFSGVELASGDVGKRSFESVMDSFGQMTDPVFNLSMLSGIMNAFGSSYSQGNPLLEIGKNAGESYVGQFMPTVLSQIARTTSPFTTTTTSTAPTGFVKDFDRFKNQQIAKLPYFNQKLQPNVNTLGDTDRKTTAGDYILSAFNNFFSPGTLKVKSNSSVNEEILNLANSVSSTDLKSILPKNTTDYEIKGDNKTYRMTNKELTAYKKNRGGYSSEKLTQLFDSDKYYNMSNDEKVKAISQIYTDANAYAKNQFLKSKGYSTGEIAYMTINSKKKTDFAKLNKSGVKMTKDEFGKAYKSQKKYDSYYAKAVSTIKNGADTYEKAKAINGSLHESSYNKAKALINSGYTAKQVEQLTSKKTKAKIDSDGNGYPSKAEIIAYVNEHATSQSDARRMFTAIAPSNWNNPY